MISLTNGSEIKRGTMELGMFIGAEKAQRVKYCSTVEVINFPPYDMCCCFNGLSSQIPCEGLLPLEGLEAQKQPDP